MNIKATMMKSARWFNTNTHVDSRFYRYADHLHQLVLGETKTEKKKNPKSDIFKSSSKENERPSI